MADRKDFRRRILGGGFLLAAVGLLIIGETSLAAWLRARPAGFLLFWLTCFVCVGLALLIALLDMAVVRRRIRREQRELFEQTLKRIAEEKASKARKASGNP